MDLWGHDKICALGDSALFKFNDKKDKKNKFLDILKTKLSVGISSLFFLSFLSFKNYCCLIVDGKDNFSR